MLTECDIHDMTSHVILGMIQGTDGGSINVDLFTPTEGYMVGGHSWSMVVHKDLTDRITIGDYLRAHTHVLHLRHKYLGWWQEGSRWWFDVSDNVMQKEEAISLGKMRGELAIYDVREKKEITL